MINDDILNSLVSEDVEENKSALNKLLTYVPESLEEAQIIVNLFVPFFKSPDINIKTLANRVYIEFKKHHFSIDYPQGLMDSSVALRNLKEKLDVKSDSTAKVAVPPPPRNERVAIVPLPRSTISVPPPPQRERNWNEKFCADCGQNINQKAEICPRCGVRQTPPVDSSSPRRRGKDRKTAAFLAIVFGNIGVHKFYLGNHIAGVLSFLFCLTFIPGVIAIFEGINYLLKTDEEFERLYPD